MIHSTLYLEQVTKKYSGQSAAALSNFSLQVAKGEMIALAGESGCGKTTLLRLIAGLEQADKGTMKLSDEITFSSEFFMQPDKRNIGLVFQDYALFPHLTVAENVAFGLKKNAKTKVAEMLQFVGLEEYSKRYPHELSGGQQQRVALARALAPEPHILLLDEPFSNLDENLKDQMRLEIRQLLKKIGITSILVTHDTRDALTVADKIAVLRKGELQQFDTPEKIYFSPVNEYVAKFFGKINFIRPNTSLHSLFNLPKEKSAALRPENIYFTSNENYISLKANVLSSNFVGAYTEIVLEGEGEKWIARTHQAFEIGKELQIFIDSNKIIVW